MKKIGDIIIYNSFRDTCCYDIDYKNILIAQNIYNEFRNSKPESVFNILHEQGHHYYITKMSKRRYKLYTKDVECFNDYYWYISYNILKEEIKAWRYVFKCIKREYYSLVKKHAIKQFKTYLVNLDKHDKKYWNKKIKFEMNKF